MAEDFEILFKSAMVSRSDDLAAAKDTSAVNEIIEEAVDEVKNHPLRNDRWIYRATVVVLGSAVISVVVGYLILALNNPNAKIPEALVAIGSTAIGALAGLLAPIGNR
jgi:hypothetical protein